MSTNYKLFYENKDMTFVNYKSVVFYVHVFRLPSGCFGCTLGRVHLIFEAMLCYRTWVSISLLLISSISVVAWNAAYLWIAAAVLSLLSMKCRLMQVRNSKFSSWCLNIPIRVKSRTSPNIIRGLYWMKLVFYDYAESGL